MDTLRLGTALYATRGAVSVKVSGQRLNQFGIAGLNTSSHRLGETTPPKVSLAAKIFDVLLKTPGQLKVYENGGSMYVETGEHKVFVSNEAGSIVCHSDSELHSYNKVLPYLCYELSDNGKNNELKETFCDVIKAFEDDDPMITNPILKFCDSFYYGCAKQTDTIKIDTDFSTAEPFVKAAFSSGELRQCSFMMANCGKYLGKSEYEKESAATETGKAPKKKSGKVSSFIEECKAGKYRVPYKWDKKMEKYIISPSFLDSFEPTPEFEEVVKKITLHTSKVLERMDAGLTGADAIGKDFINVMLLGKPGTGKTTLAYALSAATGMPVCTTAWTKNSDEEEVEGKTKIVDSKASFVETDSLLFHEMGGIDVNEEVNLADQAVLMGALGQKIEYPFIVKKNGYESVVRHPLNIIIGTMNVGTNGSKPLNQALSNRFKSKFILDDPTRDTFINILVKSTGKEKKICEWVYDSYTSVTDYLRSPSVNEEDICNDLSIRTCIGAIENMEEGQTPRRALVNSVVGAIAAVDLDVARKVESEVIAILPEPKFTF